MTDRFKDLDPRDQRIASLRRDGYLPVDVHGRLRLPLGNGPESQLVRAMYDIQTPVPPKATRAISMRDFKACYMATATANLWGWVLNTFVTIAWRVDEQCSETFAAQCHEALLNRMRAWFRDRKKARPDLPFAGIWVKECGRSLGLHSHFLVHVPHELRFDFRRWITTSAHRIVEAPPLNPFAPQESGRLVHVSPNFDTDVDEQWTVFRYMMKGLEPDALLTLRQEQTHIKHLVREFGKIPIASQGIIMGRRTGYTRDIGPGALDDARAMFSVPKIWPDNSLQGETLAYTDVFLKAGEIGRNLLGIEI